MQEKSKCTRWASHRSRNKFIFSALLILAGVILLGLNVGFIPVALKPVLISWQMLLIVFGFLFMFKIRIFNGIFNAIAIFKGIFAVFVGAFFLMPVLHKSYPQNFAWAGENFVQVYYPLLLIAGGVLFVVYWLLPSQYKHQHFSYSSHKYTCGDNCEYGTKGKTNCGCTLEKNIIFAGSDEIYLDEAFKGGSINIVFGGLSLDLRRTVLPEGDTFLEINTVFGGVTLFVPDSWFVEIRSDNIFAGFVDKRNLNADKLDKSRKLIITGASVFGGGEINS
ncbi:MAG: cell wall-active antibiotics response protein [Prevotellaceae bacterium]|jgi:predicted membrane protein|nr:cell wall-active antibiotics response protein [Prevotellaceae bacterium]